MLALGMIAALAMPGTAQATPQLGDLGVKQSMSVKASNGESLEGKDLRAIQLAKRCLHTHFIELSAGYLSNF